MKALAIIEVRPEDKTTVITFDEVTVIDINGTPMTPDMFLEMVSYIEDSKKSAEEVINLWNQKDKP